MWGLILQHRRPPPHPTPIQPSCPQPPNFPTRPLRQDSLPSSPNPLIITIKSHPKPVRSAANHTDSGPQWSQANKKSPAARSRASAACVCVCMGAEQKRVNAITAAQSVCVCETGRGRESVCVWDASGSAASVVPESEDHVRFEVWLVKFDAVEMGAQEIQWIIGWLSGWAPWLCALECSCSWMLLLNQHDP